MSVAPPLILASGSAVRARLLADAGVAFTREVAPVDEAEIKATVAGEGGTAAMAAETLAEMKAQRVSRRRPDALVIGADQILECDGDWFDKPADMAAARAALVKLRGRQLPLSSSAKSDDTARTLSWPLMPSYSETVTSHSSFKSEWKALLDVSKFWAAIS